jgi:hypothetical protein
MPTLADVLRQTGYSQNGELTAPASNSPMTAALAEHIKTLPQQLATNQAALDNAMGSWNKTNFATGQPNPNYRPEAIQELTQLMPNFAGTFIGPQAKMWNSKAAFEAAKMEKAGKTPEEIWQKTGTGRGLDNSWQQEISDKDIPVLNYGTVKDLAKYPQMREVLGHKELYDNYGNILAAAPVGADEHAFVEQFGKKIPSGSFNMRTNEYTVSPRPEGGTGVEYAQGQRSALLHELQHGIQKLEGWAQGGNIKTFTQQKDAELARDVLNFRKEIERYKGLPNDEIESKIRSEYKKAGVEDWMPSQEAINLAFDLEGNPQHELQAIVNLYGLDKKVTPDTPEKMYKRIAGEAQSRLTQAREQLTNEQRRQYYPFKEGVKEYGLDINPEDAIIHRGDELMTRKEMLQKLFNK